MIRSILVIDDDDIFRVGLERVLQFEGFEVESASDGNKGIQVFRKRPFDLVITDILMPDKEGIETIIEIMGEKPEQKILAMSGGGRGSPDQYLEFARDFGARRILQKPFKIDHLLDLIRELDQDDS